MLNVTPLHPSVLLLSHPTGNNFVREAASAFHQSEDLGPFHTSLACSGENLWSHLSRLPGMSEVARRSYPDELAPYVRLHPWPEIARLIAARLGLRSLTRHETGIFSVDAVYRSFDKAVARSLRKQHAKRVASGEWRVTGQSSEAGSGQESGVRGQEPEGRRQGAGVRSQGTDEVQLLTTNNSQPSTDNSRRVSAVRAVYCYEDGALETFRTAKSLGLTCIYDLPIAYWRTARRLLDEEAARRPEWEPTLVGTRDSSAKCARKDEELSLADIIICPSTFVRDSLPEDILASKPVHVIPFGSPALAGGVDSCPLIVDRNQSLGDSGQLSVVRGQESEIRGQEVGIRGQESGGDRELTNIRVAGKESLVTGGECGKGSQLTTDNHLSRHSRMTTAEQPSTPYLSPSETLNTSTANFNSHGAPLRVLFAGSMTQRKGLADLFDAFKLLDQAAFELHVLGSPVAPLSFYKQQFPDFTHHATRPNAAVLALMQTMDVFVLPSIVEGRALVQQEALACGLPIIVTKNAGAEDLVEDGTAGYLVPIRDPQAIAEKLEILHHDRDRLTAMKQAAIRKAREVTWEAYRARLVSVVR